MKRLMAISGGQPLKAEDWELIQDAARDSVNAVVKGLAGITTPCIITGMEVTYPDENIAISAGYMFDGTEICYVPAAIFAYQGELPDSPGSVGYRLFFTLYETDSESRVFKDNASKNVYRLREYRAVYQDTQPSGSLALPPRMMDLVASFVAPLVPIPSSVVSYLKKSFSSVHLQQFQYLLPAPGVGKAIQIISLSAHIAPSPQLDAGSQTLKVFYGVDVDDDTIGEFPNDFVESGSQLIKLLTIGSNIIANKPVSLCFSETSQPTGSATFNIHCIYKTITL